MLYVVVSKFNMPSVKSWEKNTWLIQFRYKYNMSRLLYIYLFLMIIYASEL